MDIKYHHEKILIIVALTLCTGILFYNAFFIPQVSIPSVIYVEKEDSKEVPEESQSTIIDEENTETPDTQKDNSNKTDRDRNTPNTQQGEEAKVNINTATAEELAEKLTRIGPAIAKRIVEYRNTNGVFTAIEEIKNVSGIGEKIFEQIKDDICV